METVCSIEILEGGLHQDPIGLYCFLDRTDRFKEHLFFFFRKDLFSNSTHSFASSFLRRGGCLLLVEEDLINVVTESSVFNKPSGRILVLGNELIHFLSVEDDLEPVNC